MGKILVVDDDIMLGRVLTRLLQEAGHLAKAVTNLQAGVAQLTSQPYDVVYCDVRLHQEIGLDLLQMIRPIPTPPLVIIITAYPSLETAQQALRDGAFDYLVKPILEEALLRSVNRALAAKQFQTERENLRLHLQAVLHCVDEALFSVCDRLIVRSANHKAQQICGITLSDNQESLLSLLDHCDGPCLGALQRAIQGETVTLLRQSCHCPHRSDKMISLKAMPLHNSAGAPLGAVLAIKDETELVQLQKSLQNSNRHPGLLGRSPAMQQLKQKIEQVAEVETTVLLCGESGTGKELVVEAIHRAGSRAEQPLVRVNCVALNDTLLESELFGHVRGAFTGAVRDRVGRFQEAHRGTIFLDEIGDISPALQMRLLRVLQEKTFERVGDNRTWAVDVRIIAATNQNLPALVEQNRFRADLYYRLRVVEIVLPPLRQRREDIPLLVAHFLNTFNQHFGKEIRSVSDAVMARLLACQWLGNVRQLRHAIEHACVVCQQSQIELEHLPEQNPLSPPQVTAPPQQSSEQQAMLQALAEHRWHRDKAARQLGMSRSTFYRRLKQLGLDDADG
ncbi:MAG: sigma 54-interacting transcriptional regulator [Magnetococcales bacterium]|nr:sigma 54-interacting transcriptional regulator [Magnetococcales bacterium]MBF0116222.1 sigma 54-interacting transcriptional regulator [Magnetococcales bacterium]